MKSKTRLTFMSLLSLVAVLVLAACTAGPTAPESTDSATVSDQAAEPETVSEETMEDEKSNTIVDIAVADGRFETLVAAVTAAGLAETLSGDGPFTVFAPTDDAFAALPEGTVETLLEDPSGALTDILLYHVVDGAVTSDVVVTLDTADTLLGEAVAVSVADGGVLLNENVSVIITDIVADNGVIHVVDTVLLPPSLTAASEEMAADEMASNTIVDIAVADGRFETLVAAVTAAGLAETLSGDGPFTVFAPTDDAFAALPEGTVETLLEDPSGALTDILLYHVVDGAVTSDVVVTLDTADTLLGEAVTVSVADGGVLLNENVSVIITDIVADNGVIHVVDTVLLPPSLTAASEEMAADEMASNTIVDIAVADGRFETLVAAVTAAGLAETLSGDGPFTVFAPTDDAFAALPEGTVETLLEDPSGALTDILLYHVVDGAVQAETVVNLESAMTLGGNDVAINVTDEGVFLNEDIQVIITDIIADNGVIHVIDGVLIPPVSTSDTTNLLASAAPGFYAPTQTAAYAHEGCR